MGNVLPTNPTPRWAFELWCRGLGDTWCADDTDLPIHNADRVIMRVRGLILSALFGWWWYA